MNLGQFYNTKSFIHSLDPRTKLLFLIVLGSQIFFIDSFKIYIMLGGIIFFLVWISNVPPRLFFKSCKNILTLIIFTSLLNVFFTPTGNPVVKFFFVTITDYGLILAIKISVRLIILLFLSSLLTFTTSIVQLTDAFVNLLSPLKKVLPVNQIAMIFSIALRFIPVLSDELKMIMKSQMARGINFKSGNIFERVKKHCALLIPIFISAFRRADDLALAMEARCYNPNSKRNSLKKLQFQLKDYLAILFLIALSIFIFFFH